MGICREVERGRESKGRRSLLGSWGFALLAAEPCVGVAQLSCLPPAAASAELASWTAPGKTSEGNTGCRQVNSRARNLSLASKRGQKALHPAPLTALVGRHLVRWPNGTLPAPKSPPCSAGAPGEERSPSPVACPSLLWWRYKAKAHALHLLLLYYTPAESP